jgi:hypothetical protein
VVVVAANGVAQGPTDEDGSILQFATADDALATASLAGGFGGGGIGQTSAYPAGGPFSTLFTPFSGGIPNLSNFRNQPGSFAAAGFGGFTTPSTYVTPGAASSVSPFK